MTCGDKVLAMRKNHPRTGDKNPIQDSQNVDALDRLQLRKSVLALGLPAFGSLVAPPLFLLVDAAIVASLGVTALAGLGAGSTIFSAVVGLSFFLAYQTTGVVSRSLGAGDRELALRSAGSNIALGIVLGITLGFGLYFGADQLLSLIGVSANVTPAAHSWLHAIAWALPGALGSMAAVGLFRGFHNTRITLYITSLQVALNAALCWWLVLVAHWGIAGSGVATSIAETFGLGCYFIAIHHNIEGGIRQLLPRNLLAIGGSLRAGLPLIWRSLMLRGVLSGVVVAAAHLGDVQLAAFHVSYVVWYSLALSLDAIAIAAQAIIGEQVGASKTQNAHTVLWILIRWGIWLGAIQGLLVMIASPLIAGIFSSDPGLRSLIISALLLVGVHQPLAAVVFVLDGVLIGAGDTRYLAKVHTVALAVFIPLAWIVVGRGMAFEWLWVAMIVFISVRALLLVRRARTNAWIEVLL